MSFTGSTEVGRTLLAESAKTVVNASMELGGNAPFLVLADADVGAVAGAMIAKLAQRRRGLHGGEPLLRAPLRGREFFAKLAAEFARLAVGPGLTESTQIGPLVNRGPPGEGREPGGRRARPGRRGAHRRAAPDGEGFF